MSMRGSSPLPFYNVTSQQQQQYQSTIFSKIFRCITFRRTLGFRIREKYVVLFGLFVLLCICYSGYAFLPDGRNKPDSSIKKVIDKVIFEFPQPANIDPGDLVLPKPNYSGNNTFIRHNHGGLDRDNDPHKVDDRERFLGKVKESESDQIPKPKPDDELLKLEQQKHVAIQTKQDLGSSLKNNMVTPNSVGGDSDNEERREKIKQMMIHAWDNYVKYAWGANELRPISKVGHSASIFGQGNLGATIIDALDTLYIMGLMDRFETGRKWVQMSLNFNNDVRGDLSVFETNIRFVGGLLTCYALTKDELFKRRAVEIADMLLPAFDTPTGIPYAMINVKTKSGKNWGWASAGSSILSEFGTLHLEFEYLSIVTGNPVYRDKVKRIREVISEIEKPNGLYPNYLNPKTGKWGSRHVSIGALGDSFYEYLLKSWLITNKRDVQAKRMYEEAMDAFERQLFIRSQSGLLYIAEMRGSRVDQKMDHLACFSGGMFALHAVNSDNETTREHWLSNAIDIGDTCHESYIRTDTHLGPESFRFTNEFEAKTVNDREKYYILRPEVIETWFYLWRLTKEQKYRDWGWDAVKAIETYCKAEAGYSGIKNVYSKSVTKDDVQQSFFLAETLKYLYLLFSSDDVMPLDQWVFNTEAHPLPVRIRDEDHSPKSPSSSLASNNQAESQNLHKKLQYTDSPATAFRRLR